ncbi:MAG: ATP-binding protein [Vicinamibacterales bacterium]
MRADPRTSLGARIFLLAGVNLLLIAIAGVAATGLRFPHNLRDVILQASGDRVRDLARNVVDALERTPATGRDPVLASFEAAFDGRVRLVLVTNDAQRVAGARLALPPEVQESVINPNAGGPPPRRAPPPPRRGGREGQRPPGGRAGPGPAEATEPPPFLVIADSDPAYWIGIRIPIRAADSAAPTPGTLLVVPDALVTNPLLFPTRPIAWTLVAIAVTVICWLPLLRNLTRSLGRMELATARIAEGQFETALDVRRGDEVGRLARSIEQMAGRLDLLVSGQKRFLGDTAHELRSPLGRMQVALELLERRADADDRRHLSDLREDVDELTRLTDDLLGFARAELGARTVAPVPVAVGEAVARAVRLEARPDVTIEVDTPPDLEVLADPNLFVRALANILRNAVRYAGAAGPIAVRAAASGASVEIAVADQGPGVPPEDIGRIFTPFFRVDPARGRRSGGAGLGLAIVKSAVDASGGHVSCRNLSPGFEVRLSWPRVTGERD